MSALEFVGACSIWLLRILANHEASLAAKFRSKPHPQAHLAKQSSRNASVLCRWEQTDIWIAVVLRPR